MSDIAHGIRLRGFRRWYERELVQSHLQLLLLILAVLGVLGALEAASQSQRSGGAWLLMALCAVAAGGAGVLALRRYLFLLVRAEHIANQASCPHCRLYARWAIEEEVVTSGPGSLQARCKACGARWRIHW